MGVMKTMLWLLVVGCVGCVEPSRSESDRGWWCDNGLYHCYPADLGERPNLGWLFRSHVWCGLSGECYGNEAVCRLHDDVPCDRMD